MITGLYSDDRTERYSSLREVSKEIWDNEVKFEVEVGRRIEWRTADNKEHYVLAGYVDLPKENYRDAIDGCLELLEINDEKIRWAAADSLYGVFEQIHRDMEWSIARDKLQDIAVEYARIPDSDMDTRGKVLDALAEHIEWRQRADKGPDLDAGIQIVMQLPGRIEQQSPLNTENFLGDKRENNRGVVDKFLSVLAKQIEDSDSIDRKSLERFTDIYEKYCIASHEEFHGIPGFYRVITALVDRDVDQSRQFVEKVTDWMDPRLSREIRDNDVMQCLKTINKYITNVSESEVDPGLTEKVVDVIPDGIADRNQEVKKHTLEILNSDAISIDGSAADEYTRQIPKLLANTDPAIQVETLELLKKIAENHPRKVPPVEPLMDAVPREVQETQIYNEAEEAIEARQKNTGKTR